jgi:hypothetical protein
LHHDDDLSAVGDLQLGLGVHRIKERLENDLVGCLEKRLNIQRIVTIAVVHRSIEVLGCDPVEGAAINRVEMILHVLVVLNTTAFGFKILGAGFLKKIQHINDYQILRNINYAL